MAYIGYNSGNANGQRIKQLAANLQAIDAEFRRLSDLVNAIGSANLESNSEFGVATGQGTSFNDSFLQIAASWATFYGDGSGGTVREKVSRFAR
jgi:hypothetical protein